MSERAIKVGANPFSLRTVLGLVIVGAIAFLALLYFIGAGETGERRNDGAAHAAADGLNGFSGLAQLLELEGFDVRLSRNPANLETSDLLILTPPMGTDAEELGEILQNRQYTGPTLVLLPKWFTSGFPAILPEGVEQDVKDGWIQLRFVLHPEWAGELPEPYAINFIDGEEEEFGEEPPPARQSKCAGKAWDIRDPCQKDQQEA